MKNFRIFFAAALITAAFTMSGACNSALNTDLVTAESGRAAFSRSNVGTPPDTWVAATLTGYSGYTTLEGVASHAGSEFILITGTNSNAYYDISTDGSSWGGPSLLPGFNRSPSAISYIDSNYLVTAGNAYFYGAYSASGASWSNTPSIGFGTKAHVYGTDMNGNTLYIVGGQNGQAAYTTALSSAFTTIPQASTTFSGTGSAAYINSAAYGKDPKGNYVFVFGGGSGYIAWTNNILTTSGTLVTWTASANSVSIFGSTGFVNVIVYGEPNGVPTFVAVGETASGTGVAAYSTDGGNTWTAAGTITIGTTSGFFALAYGKTVSTPTPAQYFVVGDDDGNIAYSTNGNIWAVPGVSSNPIFPPSSGTANGVNGIAYGTYYDDEEEVTKGRFVAVGGGVIPLVYYADIN